VTSATAKNTAFTLCLAINYGGRAEIVDASRALARQVRDGLMDESAIDERTFADRLSTRGLPDPDLLIRTAGEMRISNYLLWQISYAELYVTETNWPDFGAREFFDAIRAYAARARKFGGVSDDDVEEAGGAGA
jgi:undecaprenyl diphosphate synthase